MASEDSVEIERKYDVDERAALPPLDELPGVARAERPVEQQLEAEYFDTAALALAAHGITLRRRTGGDDSGWHLKLPGGQDTRLEMHEPPGNDPELVPPRFLQLVRVHVRDRPLAAVARVRTRRMLHRLRDDHNGILADVADDRVQADRLGPEPRSLTWREWEIELVQGSRELLDAAEAVLAAAGGRPAAHASKLERTLGDQPLAGPAALPPPVRRKGPATAVLVAYVHAQVQAISELDPRVRRDAPDAVHQMRVATRRMRSVLGTYRRLLEPEQVNTLRAELKWLAGCLGEARDAEVMRERLEDLVACEPAELVIGPVSRRMREALGADYGAARAAVLQVLEDKRYFRLLDSLDDFLAAVPVAVPDPRPAHATVAALVRKDWKRLRRNVRIAEATPDGPDHDAALHEARKSAKRLRYAAESGIPVIGKRAARLAGAAHGLQKILGEHQDSVVTRALLRRLGAQAHLAGENAFTYGRLHALEQAMAADAESRFSKAWKRFPKVPKE
ncbi:CYTH and CHAD domain-containing protein [Arthrobacter sp. EM1]|uniref:CYTH and CHAD domain-containing protein n=3 Tax=unclassified Arthrobacter TaxID=235627 RepID=UPI00249F19B6|nr:CYTH and CHAD domain-containing protein [Arthrobacter sp. EM1]WGZ81247.1 CYTH and CHAD domain-containing protein [Arthrobacter sp. EM1]